MATKRPKPTPDPDPRPAVGASWQNRIVGYDNLSVDALQAHPDNPRLHSRQQRQAMIEMLDDVGYVAPLVVSKNTGRILDGHMRVDVSTGLVPVVYVDVTEAEERKILALMDPIGNLATNNGEVLARITEDLTVGNVLDGVLSKLIPEENRAEVLQAQQRNLAPIQTAHVLISVPIDDWDSLQPLLDQLDTMPNVEWHSTVN